MIGKIFKIVLGLAAAVRIVVGVLAIAGMLLQNMSRCQRPRGETYRKIPGGRGQRSRLPDITY